MHVLQIRNASESDSSIYEATKAVAKKAQKKFWGFNGIPSHEFRTDTGAMVYTYDLYHIHTSMNNTWLLYDECLL